MTSFTTMGTGEDLKAAVHALACGVLGLMGVAYAARREPHLAIHAVLYGVFAAYEGQRVRHHLDAWKAIPNKDL